MTLGLNDEAWTSGDMTQRWTRLWTSDLTCSYWKQTTFISVFTQQSRFSYFSLLIQDGGQLRIHSFKSWLSGSGPLILFPGDYCIRGNAVSKLHPVGFQDFTWNSWRIESRHLFSAVSSKRGKTSFLLVRVSRRCRRSSYCDCQWFLKLSFPPQVQTGFTLDVRPLWCEHR